MPSFAINANEAFDNFDELIEALNDWMDRDDLDGVASQLVALAEDEIRLELEPLFAEASASAMSDASGIAALPANMSALKRVLFDGVPVKQLSIHGLDNLPTSSTCPVGYTLERNSIRFWPNAAYTATLLYSPLLPRLSNANQTNELLDTWPSLYFYGAMTFAAGYVVDDNSRAANFRALFDNMLARVKKHYRDQRYSGPLTPNVQVAI